MYPTPTALEPLGESKFDSQNEKLGPNGRRKTLSSIQRSFQKVIDPEKLPKGWHMNEPDLATE